MPISRTQKAGPLRWRAAGQLGAWLPDVRGRDRAISLVRGHGTVTGRIRGELTNGLRFDFDDACDDALKAFIVLQYVPPALAPVLEAALTTGGSFYDVGANVGLYSAWAARIVGPNGHVMAFEPASVTRSYMERLLSVNHIRNVQIVPVGVGARHGHALLHVEDGASLQANIAEGTGLHSEPVDIVPLDDYAGHAWPPSLIKIDVEGYEYHVLDGARGLIERVRPAIVVEMLADHLARAGTRVEDIVALLGLLGYRIFDMTPGGLSPYGGNPTTNVLALCLDLSEHQRLWRQLAETRFSRNQSL